MHTPDEATETAKEIKADEIETQQAPPDETKLETNEVQPLDTKEGPAIEEPPSQESPRPTFEATEPPEIAEPVAVEAIYAPQEAQGALQVQEGFFGLMELLLKDREQLYQRLQEPDQMSQTLPGLLLIALICTSLVGGILGTYSGGWQILYVALKLPLLMLLTLVVCYGGFWVWGLYFRTQIRAEQVAALTLASIATTGLLLLGLSPFLWLALGGGVVEMKLQHLSLVQQETLYHRAILALVVSFGVAAIGGTQVLYRGIRSIASTPEQPRLGGTRMLAAVWIGMYGFVGLQMAWILRPYLFHPWAKGRPLTFVRSLDGSVYESVIKTLMSVLGLGA